MERLSLRWLRPDGQEAMAVTCQYPTVAEAEALMDALLMVLELHRRGETDARTGSRLDAGDSQMGEGDAR